MQSPNDPSFDLRNFLESRSKPELIAVIEKMNAPAWTLMFQNMTLTRPEMLAKLDVMVDRLDDLFASVDNETDIDAMDQHLTHIFQKFRGSWALVQNEMEALLDQTLHRLSLALTAGTGDFRLGRGRVNSCTPIPVHRPAAPHFSSTLWTTACTHSRNRMVISSSPPNPSLTIRCRVESRGSFKSRSIREMYDLLVPARSATSP